MKYKSYICLKYYPISFAYSMKNLSKPKNKNDQEAIKERISTINSDIEELYKKYRLTKQERIDKEKSQKNLINRINFLADEEKKISKKCELQLQKINAITKNYSTVNGTGHNTPPNQKKLHDLGSFSNYSDNKSFKHRKIYDITEEEISIENTNSKDNQNRSIMNNICIIVNNNMKGAKKNLKEGLQIDNKEDEINDNKIAKSKINNKNNKYIEINNNSISTNTRENFKSNNFNENNRKKNKYGTPKFMKDYDRNSSHQNARSKGKIKNKKSNKMNKTKNLNNKKVIITSKNKLQSKSKDILIIKTNKDAFFHNPKHHSFLEKKNKNNQSLIQSTKSTKNKNAQKINYEKKTEFNDILMTNISRSHIPKKRKKFPNCNNNNLKTQINNKMNYTYKSKNESSTISLYDANKTITYNKSIELKKKYLGIPDFELDEKINTLQNEKHIINSYKDEKTKVNNFGTHSQYFNNRNLNNGIYSNIKKIEKKKNLKSGNLLKNLDIIKRIQRNKETLKNNEILSFTMNEKNSRKEKKISDNIELNDDNSVVKIVKKIQQINEYKENKEKKENKEIQNSNITNKKTQSNNLNIPRREIEALRRINNRIENYKNNNCRNFFRRNLKKNYGNDDNKRNRASSKINHSFSNKKCFGEIDGEVKRKRYSFSKKVKHFNKELNISKINNKM